MGQHESFFVDWIGLDWIGLDWVNKLLFWIGLGQEKVTHVQLCDKDCSLQRHPLLASQPRKRDVAIR